MSQYLNISDRAANSTRPTNPFIGRSPQNRPRIMPKICLPQYITSRNCSLSGQSACWVNTFFTSSMVDMMELWY